jgi:hypothetical protein
MNITVKCRQHPNSLVMGVPFFIRAEDATEPTPRKGFSTGPWELDLSDCCCVACQELVEKYQLAQADLFEVNDDLTDARVRELGAFKEFEQWIDEAMNQQDLFVTIEGVYA